MEEKVILLYFSEDVWVSMVPRCELRDRNGGTKAKVRQIGGATRSSPFRTSSYKFRGGLRWFGGKIDT